MFLKPGACTMMVDEQIQNRLFAHDVIAVARNATGGQEVIFLHRN